MHWESGMYENTGGALPKGSFNYKIATGLLKSNSQFGQPDTQCCKAELLWRTFLRRKGSWGCSKIEALDSHVRATTQSPTWLCSTETRKQTIARRALGKDPKRLENHSSWSISKKTKKDKCWRASKNSTRGWHQNRMEVLQRFVGKPSDSFFRIAGQPADSFVIVVKLGPNPLEDEQLEFSAFFKVWRFGERKTSRQPTGSCEQHTHKYSMCRCAQCVRTHTEQIDHISPREHAWLESWKASGLHIFVTQNNCHSRVMSHSSPHLTLTTSISSLSPTSWKFPTVSPIHTRSLVHYPCLPCKVPRQSGGSTQIPSLTGTDRARQAIIDDLSVHQVRHPTNVCQLLAQIREVQNMVNSFADAREFLRSWNSEQLGSDPRSQSTPLLFESLDHASPPFWTTARYTKQKGFFRKRFWTTTCSRRTNFYSPQQFHEFGIFLSEIETWYWRTCIEAEERNETRT